MTNEQFLYRTSIVATTLSQLLGWCVFTVFYLNTRLRCIWISESTESFAVSAVALKQRLRRWKTGEWLFIIRPIVLDSISVGLTGIPVLHTVGTRRIPLGIGPTYHYACMAS